MDKEKIIIVDDEPDTLSVLEMSFIVEGYSVMTATSAKSLDTALSIANPDYPDLIVLDLDLPDMDGREIAARLKDHPVIGNIPVLFLTALYSRAQQHQQNNMLQGHLLFSKPYDIDELMAAVKQIINESKVTQEEGVLA